MEINGRNEVKELIFTLIAIVLAAILLYYAVSNISQDKTKHISEIQCTVYSKHIIYTKEGNPGKYKVGLFEGGYATDTVKPVYDKVKIGQKYIFKVEMNGFEQVIWILDIIEEK